MTWFATTAMACDLGEAPSVVAIDRCAARRRVTAKSRARPRLVRRSACAQPGTREAQRSCGHHLIIEDALAVVSDLQPACIERGVLPRIPETCWRALRRNLALLC